MNSAQEQQDIDQLRLLSIFHYVIAGIIGLASLFPFIHLFLGIAFVSGAFEDPSGPAPPSFIGWLFIGIAGAMIACGLAMAISAAIAGTRLANRRGWLFCMIVAALECTFMPIGTVLGVFTIIVLTRPSVKTAFARKE